MSRPINDYYLAPIPILQFSNVKPSHPSKKYNWSLDLSNKTRPLYGATALDKILEQGSSKPKKTTALREIFILEPLNALNDSKFQPQSKLDYPESNPKGDSSGLQDREKSQTHKENRRYTSNPKRIENAKSDDGPTIIEKSKRILERVRLPKDIFKEAYEQKIMTGDVPIGHNYPKDKLKRITKKLDLVINVERHEAEEKKYGFMKGIPQGYYHKLLEGRYKVRKQDSPCSVQKMMPEIGLNRSLITVSPTPLSSTKNVASVVSSGMSTPAVNTERRLGARARRKINGIELGIMEKNEASSQRAESGNTMKGSMQTSQERLGEKNYRRAKLKQSRRGSVELWLERTSQLMEEINKMKSANESSIEYIVY